MKFKDIKRKGDLTVAKRNIKAVVVMTKDKDGKLIPAENSVRFHYYLQGPPYFGKEYNAVYIEDKVNLYYNKFGKLKRISVDSKKDGHLAEYKTDIINYTLFGPNAGKSRPVNEGGLFLYNCIIPKGNCYEEHESGELVANYVLGEEYKRPKLLGHLEVGDKVWFAYYYLGTLHNGDFSCKDRGFRVFPEERTIYSIKKRIEDNSYSNYAEVKFSPDGATYYIRDGIYYDTHVDYADMHRRFVVISLTKEGLINAYVKKFGERIKGQMEIIEEAQEKIDEINGLIDKIKNI